MAEFCRKRWRTETPELRRGCRKVEPGQASGRMPRQEYTQQDWEAGLPLTTQLAHRSLNPAQNKAYTAVDPIALNTPHLPQSGGPGPIPALSPSLA